MMFYKTVLLNGEIDKMKVLFLTNIPSPYRVDFFNELGKLCDLTVLFENKSAKSRDADWVADAIVNFKAVFMKGIRMGDAEAFCPSVIKYLSKNKFDVIVVSYYASPSGMLAIEYMRIKKIPFIISTDGGMKKDDSSIKYRLKKHFISAASAWLSTGKTTFEYLCYYGAKAENIYTYPFTSVKEKELLDKPLSLEDKKIYRELLSINEEKVVLSVGRFVHSKGYDILLKNCAKLNKNIGVYIVGGKPTQEYLDLQKELDLTNIHLVGFKKKEQLADYYKAADIFVLPTREDIWGLVINEAMGYALPIITTDQCVAGIEMVKTAGRIVPVCSEWGNIIEQMFRNDDLQYMSEESLKCARRYTIEKMAVAHMKTFEHFLCREVLE